MLLKFCCAVTQTMSYKTLFFPEQQTTAVCDRNDIKQRKADNQHHGKAGNRGTFLEELSKLLPSTFFVD